MNVSTLGKLAEAGKLADGLVTPAVLYRLGAVAKKTVPVKILGDGNLTVKLQVSANAFSKSASEKIAAAGGKVETIPAISGAKTLES